MRTLLPPHCGLWSGSGRTWQSGPSWGMGSWTPCVQEGSSCSTVDLDSDSLYGQGFHKGRNLASSAMQRSVKFQGNTHEWDLSLKVKQYTLQDLSLKVKQSTRFKSKSKTTSFAFMTFHHQLQVKWQVNWTSWTGKTQLFFSRIRNWMNIIQSWQEPSRIYLGIKDSCRCNLKQFSNKTEMFSNCKRTARSNRN